MLNVYQFTNYRELLRESLLYLKSRFGRAFTFEKMAQSCRLQRTYLSVVLKGEGQLNADQLYAACEFLQFKDEEYQYVSLLHEYERSTHGSRRSRLQKEIVSFRQRLMTTSSRLEAQPLKEGLDKGLLEFYMDINAQLVHMFLTIGQFRGLPEKVRNALHYDASIFDEILKKIERAGLIRRRGDHVEVTQDKFHLPTTSALYPHFRTQMRLKAMEHMQQRPNSDQYSFSVLYSADENSRHKIQARFIEFIDWMQGLTQGNEPTHVYQLNFDLLKWG